MIWTALINAIGWIVSPVLDRFPELTEMNNWLEGSTDDIREVAYYVGVGASWFNGFAPMREMFIAAGFGLVLLAVVAGLHAAVWLYTHIPSVAGTGPSGK